MAKATPADKASSEETFTAQAENSKLGNEVRALPSNRPMAGSEASASAEPKTVLDMPMVNANEVTTAQCSEMGRAERSDSQEKEEDSRCAGRRQTH